MYITVTYIQLRSFWSFFSLANRSRKILGQMRNTPGVKQYKARGFGRKHYTLSLWESKEALQNFARSGAHLEAMKASPRLAQEIRTYTYPGEELPDWNQAKAVLFESGQVLDFSQKD